MTEKMPMQARPAHLLTADYKLVTWHIDVPPGVKIDHLLDPKFWAIVARQMRAGHRVIVDSQDMSWTVTLLVVEATNTSARVAVLSHNDLAAAQKSADLINDGETYSIKWGGPHAKWMVIREADKAEMRRDMEKEEAQKWVRDRAVVEAH